MEAKPRRTIFPFDGKAAYGANDPSDKLYTGIAMYQRTPCTVTGWRYLDGMAKYHCRFEDGYEPWLLCSDVELPKGNKP